MAEPITPPSGKTMIMIDRIACTGRGLCAIVLPERIALDEWGYPVIDPTPVAEVDATDAVRICPHRALRLARETAQPRRETYQSNAR